MRRSARFVLLTLGAMAGGCELQHQDVAMRGDADGVIINYAGDIAETLPLARQHCAQYERVPVLHQAADDHAVYFCVRPGTPPGPS